VQENIADEVWTSWMTDRPWSETAPNKSSTLTMACALQSGPSMTLPNSVTSVTAGMLFVSTEHAEEDRGGKGKKPVGSRAARAK
jgi:hypothetical protein